MTDAKLAENYISTAKAKSAKLETDILLILSALILLWISMEAGFPDIHKEVLAYNGYKLQDEYVSKKITSTQQELLKVDSIIRITNSHSQNTALLAKEQTLTGDFFQLQKDKIDISKKRSHSEGRIKYKVPFVGEIEGPYYLSTVIWDSLAILFIVYLFNSREKILFYYYNALNILQIDSNNSVERDLALNYSVWCLPLRNGASTLSDRILSKSFGYEPGVYTRNVGFPILLFGLMLLMSIRSAFLSFWVFYDLREIWWYYLIFILNVVTLGIIIYFIAKWFLPNEIEFLNVSQQKSNQQ